MFYFASYSPQPPEPQAQIVHDLNPRLLEKLKESLNSFSYQGPSLQ